MRKFLSIVLTVAFVLSMTVVVNAEVDKDITFKNIPWGTSFTESKENYVQNLAWSSQHGDWMRVLTIGDITADSYDSNKFKNNDLCLHAYSIDSVEVAGYEVSQTDMYYAFVPVNGIVTHEDADTSLYCAEYEIEPVDLDSAFDDLFEKMKSVYGEPDTSKTYSIFVDCENLLYYWYGTNDTMAILKKEPYVEGEGAVHIFYAWKNGDKLLHDADDVVSGIKADEESAIYGNDNTEGL